MNDEEIKQAALEFARLQPVQWDAFLAKWETDHSCVGVAETEVPVKWKQGNVEYDATEIIKTGTASPEPTVEDEETKPEVETPVVQPRKVASRKTKAKPS